jgi:AraC family transcriptional regulator
MPAVQPSTTIQATYGERIARVGEHIRAKLGEPLDLDRLAGIACFSPWHFHRIYTAVTGETVAETYRRHRLHHAAVELVRSERPVADLARIASFGSAAAFIRAFSQAYGVTPGEFRRRRRPPGPSLVSQPEVPTMSNVDIVSVSAEPMIALAHKGDYNKIGDAFEKLGAWAGSRGLINGESRMIGIFYDDPDVVAQTALRSHACLTKPAGASPELPYETVSLPGGTYARAVHKGPYADLHAFYQKLFREWLPTSGREPADGPCFEDYLNDPAKLPPTEWLTAVHVPLKA